MVSLFITHFLLYPEFPHRQTPKTLYGGTFLMLTHIIIFVVIFAFVVVVVCCRCRRHRHHRRRFCHHLMVDVVFVVVAK